MKRQGNIYKDICDIENIRLAIYKAAYGKRKKNNVKRVLDDIDKYAYAVQKMLKERTFRPSPYSEKTIRDTCAGKNRTIFKPRFFPDQIVHWSLMLQIQPLIMRGMYAWSCGSIPKRGIHYCKKNIEKVVRQDRKNTKYCLKLDISKFYPSINKNLLKQSFRRIIKDEETLKLIDVIIDSHENGLPIGNYTSQWFANWFLQDLDHFIKEQLHVKHYYRYVDDMVLFGSNKKRLHKIHKAIEEYLHKYKDLSIKENWQVFKFDSRGLDFLGFRIFRTHTILRKRNALKIRRAVKKASKKEKLDMHTAMRVISYLGWLKHCNSQHFRDKYITPLVNMKTYKGVIRNAFGINSKTTA